MAFSQNPIIYLTRKMWEYSKGNRRHVVDFYARFFLANTVDFFKPFIIALVLNTIQQQGINRTTIHSLILMVFIFPAFTLIIWILHGPARVIELKNAFLVRAHYKKFLLDGTMQLPARWHVDHHSGDTIDRINKGSEALYGFSGEVFQIISALMILVTCVGTLIYFDLLAGAMAVLAMVLTFGWVLVFDRKLAAQYLELNHAENGISAKVFDVISNMTTVIILRLEKLVSKDLFKKILQPFSLYKRNVTLNEVKWFGVSVFGSTMTFLVMVIYFIAIVHSGRMIAVGTVFLLYSYVQRIEDVFFRFAYTYSDLVHKQAQVMNAEELADEFRQLSHKHVVTLHHWKKLHLTGLTFSYHEEQGADLHLQDIDFEAQRGEKIALIGASGSGKTTLLKILRGLYLPHRSHLVLDGRVVSHGLKVLSDTISLIPQDPEIFATTIRENITVGRQVTDADMKRFTDMARFTEVAERLPHKLDSSIFEKGVNLSGGEKQRLALARGLLASQDKSIVLLDEPTSSVDAVNEQAIYKNIFSAFRSKTIISSIHRLRLLPMFDRIYFFRGGRVIAHGSFDQLLKTSPDFQTLWQKHAASVPHS